LYDAVARAELGHSVVTIVCAPNVRAVKGEKSRAIPDGKALDESRLVEFPRVCRWDGKPAEEHEAHRHRNGDTEQSLKPLFEYSFH